MRSTHNAMKLKASTVSAWSLPDSVNMKAANTTAASQRYEKMRLKRIRNGRYVPMMKTPRKKATVRTDYTGRVLVFRQLED